jgi:D-sedoheptulose 7-phosphate isomerase
MTAEYASYIQAFLRETERICESISHDAIERILAGLIELRAGRGRLFILGVGGSAANASHAVNDFRKIANIECYAPTDNVAELTARINDDGWDTSYARWLSVSRLGAADAILVFSVSGGNEQRPASVNLVEAVRLARKVGAKVYAILGEDGGYTGKVADACVMVPVSDTSMSIPQVEGFQALLWHLIVTHPALVADAAERPRTEASRSCSRDPSSKTA